MNQIYHYVYIMANKKNGTLYVGITSNLEKRVFEHKNDITDGFTKRYKLNNLVYYEVVEEVYTAIQREKRFKKWNRKWKIDLIEKFNPNWEDLSDKL